MGRIRRSTITAALAIIFVLSAHLMMAAQAPPRPDTAKPTGVADAMIRMANAERVARGLGALQEHEALADAAEWLANDMGAGTTSATSTAKAESSLTGSMPLAMVLRVSSLKISDTGRSHRKTRSKPGYTVPPTERTFFIPMPTKSAPAMPSVRMETDCTGSLTLAPASIGSAIARSMSPIRSTLSGFAVQCFRRRTCLLGTGKRRAGRASLPATVSDVASRCRGRNTVVRHHVAWKFRKNPHEEGYEPISADRLAVGMEIWLTCAWYKHPFPTNRFTVSSAEQIQLIRRLHLAPVHYNPYTYRPIADPTPERGACRDAPCPDGLEGIPAEWVAPAGQATRPKTSPVALRHIMGQAQQAYRDALRTSSECLRQINAGLRAGSDVAGALVQHFVDQVMKDDGPVALADVLHLNVLERAQAPHGLNTCLLSVLVARELDLEPEELTVAGMAGLLHDLGEQRLPSQLRWKTERLTRAETSLYQLHPLYGREMLEELPGLPDGVAEIVAQHHECLDGTGYPRRLTDEQILPLAKLVRVVDEYQYLTNPRDGQHRLQPNQALAELFVRRRAQLPVQVIIALIRVVGVYPPGTLVELSDGHIGTVLNSSARERLRPIVLAYRPGGSDGDPQLIDLGEAIGLSIVRPLGAGELSPELAQRLAPAEALHCLLQQGGTGRMEKAKTSAR